MRARVASSWGLLPLLLTHWFVGCGEKDDLSRRTPRATATGSERADAHDGGGGAHDGGGGARDGGRPAPGSGLAGEGGVADGPDGRPSFGGEGGAIEDVGGQAGDSFTHPGGDWGSSGGAGGEEACATCHARTATDLTLGEAHSCVRFLDGSVKCWGRNQDGELGRGDHEPIGDDELPSSIDALSLSHEPGVVARSFAAGARHTCAILSNDTVKCWGDGSRGQLGYGAPGNVGDDERPADVDPIELSTDPHLKPSQVATGDSHSCALLSDGSVKCWGSNDDFALGYPGAAVIGATDTPADWDAIDVTATPGVKVVQLACGHEHTCALLSDRSVSCWGRSTYGQLGYGNRETIGDDEAPSSAGPVSVTTEPGVSVTALSARAFETCALLSSGKLKCWGRGSAGALGNGDTRDIGDDELPSDVDSISPSNDASLLVTHVGSGAEHTCALLSNASISCWGDPSRGRLGSASGGIVSLSQSSGVVARRLATGFRHSCALLSDGSLTCWGDAAFGALGYGNSNIIGDDELPASAAPVVLFGAL